MSQLCGLENTIPNVSGLPRPWFPTVGDVRMQDLVLLCLTPQNRFLAKKTNFKPMEIDPQQRKGMKVFLGKKRQLVTEATTTRCARRCHDEDGKALCGDDEAVTREKGDATHRLHHPALDDR